MSNLIADKFEKMGVRARIVQDPRATVRVNVLRDGSGEYFELRHGQDVNLTVLDVRPADRHLLLMAHQSGQPRSKFLCGHDERHWFVAAVPERVHARDVQSAKDGLKPEAVWTAMRRFGVRMRDRNKRRTDGFVRQGEWFFLPRPWLKPNETFVLKNEPIRRGAGKPHMCQFLYREGGEPVYVCSRYPNGFTTAQYAKLSEAERKNHAWTPMVRDAKVYVKGHIRHPDHKTVWLGYWHQVVMNTETQAAAMRQVAFLD
jgi:hypothetical protein